MKNTDINKKSLEYLKTLSLKELRKKQAIINFQIPIAYKKHLTEALERLQLMSNQVNEAIYYVAFIKK